MWAFYATCTITLLPIWEGKRSMKLFFVYIFKGKGELKRHAVAQVMATEGVDISGDGAVSARGSDHKGSEKIDTRAE